MRILDRFGTFMYIPHQTGEVRAMRLSRRVLVGGATCAMGLLALVVGAVLSLLAPGTIVPPLGGDDPRARAELAKVEGRIGELSQRLERLLDREEELRIAADLPAVPVEVQAVGVGGPGPTPFDPALFEDAELGDRMGSVATSIDLLLRRSERIAESFEDVEASIAENVARFESTPSIWPASGFLSSTYSHRRRHPIFHDLRPHYGIDISARRGDPIVATAAGRIVEAGWSSGHGNYVEIDHGHGVVTTYSHASRVLVDPGERVTRGQRIALIGSTGFSVAPHVHYEVHEDGRAVDPLKYIFPDAIAD